MKFAHLDDHTAWPKPDAELDELNHTLRYGDPTRSDMLSAAEVLSAYRALIGKTQRRRNWIVTRIKRAMT